MQATLRCYLQLTKPGIVAGNLLMGICGFIFAIPKEFDAPLFFSFSIGLSLIIASGSAINNYIDRASDRKMERTQGRPLATGIIPPTHALLLGALMGTLGVVLLWSFTTPLATLLAIAGLLIYDLLYSFYKYRSPHATLIGAVAGALPPLIGYAAASCSFRSEALLLFFILFFWQMPHFYAIALMRLEEYRAANIPVLPLRKGILQTKLHIVFYIFIFSFVIILPFFLHVAGTFYFIFSLILSFIWIALSIQGFFAKKNRVWARYMFQFSLLILTSLVTILCCFRLIHE